MNVPALAVGVLAVFVTARGLIIGSASPQRDGIRREEQPVIYWAVMAAGTLLAGFLLYIGVTT